MKPFHTFQAVSYTESSWLFLILFFWPIIAICVFLLTFLLIRKLPKGQGTML